MTHSYLVTGGAGFIGSNFVLYLLGRYDAVHVINVDALTYAGNRENLASVESDSRYSFIHEDIRDTSALKRIFSEFQPDYVINFAAESHVDRSIENPAPFADTNVLGTVNLLNAAKACWEQPGSGYGKHRFLQVSTDEVYGSLPLDETDTFFYEDTPVNPRNPYAASKAAADMFVKAYGNTYGMPVIITRCSNNYGPFQHPEKLIPLMIDNAIHHRPLPIYGDGLNVRDWIYVGDHCKALDRVLERGKPGEIYNIGCHNEIANNTLVHTIIEECSRELNDPTINDGLITYVEDRKGHDRRYAIAPDKIMQELGWQPEMPFETGIVETIRWYLSHQDWLESATSHHQNPK